MGTRSITDIRLVIDYNVQMVTSKHHKTDEKHTHFVVQVSPPIFDLKNFQYTQPHFKNTVGYFSFLFVDYCISNVHRSFVIFWFFSIPPKIIYLFVELSF